MMIMMAARLCSAIFANASECLLNPGCSSRFAQKRLTKSHPSRTANVTQSHPGTGVRRPSKALKTHAEYPSEADQHRPARSSHEAIGESHARTSCKWRQNLHG